MIKDLTKHKDFLSVTIIFLLAFIFFLKGFLQNQIIWGFDTPKIIFPLIFLLDESFKQLQLPLWTPDIYFGFPIGAEGQVGWFYVFNLLHIFLPLNWAVLSLSLLHVSLAGIFTYIFSRLIGLSRLASLFSGIVFMFNGFIIAHLQYFDFIYAYAYLPLILLLAELGIQKGKILFFLFAGVGFGLQIPTGHPNIPVMTFIYVVIYTFFRLFNNKLLFLKNIAIFLIISILIALPYLLLIMTLVPFSIRAGGIDFAEATSKAFSFFDFITFFFPNFYFSNLQNWTSSTTWHLESYWGQIETTGYVGILTLFFIPFAFLKRIRQKTFIFLILLLISLMLALGKSTPFYTLLFNIPIINGLRFPGRFLFMTDFSLIILAGFGITALFQEANFKKIKINTAIILTGCSIFAFVIVGSFLARFHPELSYNFILKNYAKLGYVEYADNPTFFKQMIITSFTDQTKMGLIFIALSMLIILSICNGFKKPIAKIIILTFIIVDLFTFATKVNIWKNFNELINVSDPIINKLENELTYETGRIYTPSNYWSELMPDQLIQHHIPEANGFASLPLKRFDNWQREAESELIKGKTNLFEIGSIKYIYNRDNLIVVDKPLPRAYVANAYIGVKDESESFKLLTGQSFDPNMPIIESDNSYFVTQRSNQKISPAKIEVYKPQYIKITSNVSEDGLLVLTDTYFPGWEAYLNGEKVPIYQTNYLFRGVIVQKGENTVEFKYQPKYLYVAIVVSFCAILFVLLYLAKRLLKNNSLLK